jgi:hypothetical protein
VQRFGAKASPSMLASFPASMVNQKSIDFGNPKSIQAKIIPL